MGRILFAWELGAGLGHLLPHRPLFAELLKRGHELHVVARDLTRVTHAFGDMPISYWQAPLNPGRSARQIRPTFSMTHILHNVGYTDSDRVAVVIGAWRNVVDSIRPDLVLADYCVGLLLALRDRDVPTICISTGFDLPPRESPWPAFPVQNFQPDYDELARNDARLTSSINAALTQHRLPSLDHLSVIHERLAAVILLNYRELEYYPGRTDANYCGISPVVAKTPPRWPRGTRRRIFGYLKPFPGLRDLLQLLVKLKVPTVISSDGIPLDLQQAYRSETLHFEQVPVNLGRASAECHLAITNANHMSTTRFLLAGRPVLMIPLQLEQELNAANVSRLGAGVVASATDPQSIITNTANILNSDDCLHAAREFAARYPQPTTETYALPIADRIEKLIAQYV